MDIWFKTDTSNLELFQYGEYLMKYIICSLFNNNVSNDSES
jgi:hypothetical protein